VQFLIGDRQSVVRSLFTSILDIKPTSINGIFALQTWAFASSGIPVGEAFENEFNVFIGAIVPRLSSKEKTKTKLDQGSQERGFKLPTSRKLLTDGHICRCISTRISFLAILFLPTSANTSSLSATRNRAACNRQDGSLWMR